MEYRKLALISSAFWKRMQNGETFEQILKDYPNLSEDEINLLKDVVAED